MNPLKTLLLFAFFISTFTYGTSQEIINEVFLKTITKNTFINDFGVPAKADVHLYRVEYTTKDLSGALDTASGLVCLPDIEGYDLAMISYSHGTVGSRYEVPSYLSYEHTIPSIYASLGGICFAPDYLGLGVNDGLHPYVHAESEAWVNMDMMIALKSYLPQWMGINTSDQLFITGYSQGGHAAMAFHRKLETETFYTVSGAVPMSGPYSISTGMKDLFLSNDEYLTVAYIASVALSYQEVYGDIFENGDLNNFFKAPYVEMIRQFRDEEIDLWTLNSRLINALTQNEGGAFPKKMVKDEIVDAIINDNNHPVNVALRKNDVYDWKPNAPTLLLYCNGDEQVAYVNSLIARDTMKANGAQDVLAISLSSTFDHGQCVQPAVTNMVFYLLANMQLIATGIEQVDALQYAIYPNPTVGNFTINISNRVESLFLHLYDYMGKQVMTKDLNEDITTIQTSLVPGMYHILIVDSNGFLVAKDNLVVK